MIASIHQPNFLPWMGFFAKLMASDVMILMDNAQFPKGSWTNRVRVGGANATQWLTVPVMKHALASPISAIRISYDHDWRAAHLRTLEMRYRRGPGYGQALALIEPVYARRPEFLADLNVSLIRSIASALRITTTLRLGSELDAPGDASVLLANMCRAVGATSYLAGAGAADYDDLAVYEAAGVRYGRYPFRHPTYAQHGSAAFAAGLTIIDAIVSVSLERTRGLLGESIGVHPTISTRILPLTLDVARRRETELLALLRDFPELSWSAENLFLEQARKWVLSAIVVDDDDAIIAVSINSAKEDALYIHLILVATSHRGRGVGAQLISHVSTVARRSGLRCIRLKTAAARQRTVAFYERIGFTQVAHEPNGDIVFECGVGENGMPSSTGP